MIEIYPSYYERFRCIADRCEDTCCAGWEIDIDDDTYERYMRVGGDLGARLRACTKVYEGTDDGYEEVYEQHGFVLTEDLRCPFLDENNLCDIYRELGEDALCEVCTHTPRNYLEYMVSDRMPDTPNSDDATHPVREISLSASCPEAARLIYGSPERISFVKKEVPDEESITDREEGEPDEEEAELGAFLKNVRDEAIRMLQDREYSLTDRIRIFLKHSEAVQEAINRWEAGGAENLRLHAVSREEKEPMEKSDGEAVYRHFLIRMGTFSGLASIGKGWKDKVEGLFQSFVGEEEENQRFRERYLEASDNLLNYLTENNRLYEYEHLLVYYAFLLLNRSIDDYDYLGKAKLVVLSYLMNRDMDAAVFLQKGILTREDRQENARLYAREVEHAEENLADLAEEILFERAYDAESLVSVI